MAHHGVTAPLGATHSGQTNLGAIPLGTTLPHGGITCGQTMSGIIPPHGVIMHGATPLLGIMPLHGTTLSIQVSVE